MGKSAILVMEARTAWDDSKVIPKINAVTDASRANGYPVIFSTLRSGGPKHGFDIHPSIKVSPTDILLEMRSSSGAFKGGELKAKLDGLGVSQVEIVGFADMAVVNTAFAARKANFGVRVIEDAFGAFSEGLKASSVEQLKRNGVSVVQSAQVIQELARV